MERGSFGGRLPDRLQTERDFLPYVLALVGITIAVLTSISIEAANDAIGELCGKWTKIEEGFDSDVFWLLPDISGGGHPTAARRGRWGSRFIPWIIVVIWSCVMVMFTNDKLQQARHHDGKASLPAAGVVEGCGFSRGGGETTSAREEGTSKRELMREIGCATGFSAGAERQLHDEYGVSFRVVPEDGVEKTPSPEEKR